MNIRKQLEVANDHLVHGRHDDAIRIYRKILQQHPRQPDAIHFLGVALGSTDPKQAESLLKQSLKLLPDNPVYYNNIADYYGRKGQFDLAQQFYRRAIELKPDYAEAYTGLSAVYTAVKNDPLINTLLTQLDQQNITTAQRRHYHFSLAKFYNDLQDYDRAFIHYQSGNEACQTEVDIPSYAERINRFKRLFTPGYFTGHYPVGSETEQPVFVVGMPRSGTTLIEQILSSHSQIEGVGELSDVGSMAAQIGQHSHNGMEYPECMSSVAAKVLQGYAHTYLQRTTPTSDSILRVVDKMPANYLYLGLIAHLFPRARVIHVQRHPLDTCLSCYFQNFNSQVYSFNMRYLGRIYRLYADLMAHWQAVLPIRIMNVSYEALIEAPEKQVRAMLTFLGLEWQQACLNFYDTQRDVKTASRWQVRQPLYTASIGRWKNYAEHLGPLREELGDLIE